MENREFYLPCDGLKVHAKLDFPEGEKDKYPLLVVFHGFTGHMEEDHIVGTAKAAREIGFATIRTEFYGHGKSEGQFREHTILHWLTQALRIIDYACHLDFVSGVWLAGHSQGGLTAVLAAGMMPDRIRGLIPMSPAMNIPYGAKSGNFLGFSYDPDHPGEEIVNDGGSALSSNYARAARILPVEECIQYWKGPTLIIHGTADEAVPYHFGTDLLKKYTENGTQAELVSIEGADHCYTHPGNLKEAEDAVQKFLAAQIQCQ